MIKRNKKGQFTKGQTAWNKGIKRWWVTSQFEKGKHYSPETEFKKGEMSKKQKGKNNSYWKGGLPKCKICKRELLGYKTKICRSCFTKSENHPKWQGGKSFEKYGVEFNYNLKEQIRKRDNFICQQCKVKQKNLEYKLIVHHIDYNKMNNNLNNLISFCRNCHMKLHNNKKYEKNKI